MRSVSWHAPTHAWDYGCAGRRQQLDTWVHARTKTYINSFALGQSTTFFLERAIMLHKDLPDHETLHSYQGVKRLLHENVPKVFTGMTFVDGSCKMCQECLPCPELVARWLVYKINSETHKLTQMNYQILLMMFIVPVRMLLIRIANALMVVVK